MSIQPKQMNRVQQLASQIVNALGETLLNTDFLESGSTSNAFKITTNQTRYVLRIANPNSGKSAAYESDFGIREQLWKQGLPVAQPIATNHSVAIDLPPRGTADTHANQTLSQETWALDVFCSGVHPQRGNISHEISSQIGSLLRSMHKLPVTGFGRLKNHREDFHGEADQPVQGILSRFESPWPFSSTALADHPAIQREPGIRHKLLGLENELSEFVTQSVPAVVHTDLHERQMLVVDGKLNALLDFNEAILARREWDLGSYLYFHGTDCLNDLLQSYSECEDEKKQLYHHARLAAILIALHHGNRGVVLGKPHRIDASLLFLQRVLAD